MNSFDLSKVMYLLAQNTPVKLIAGAIREDGVIKVLPKPMTFFALGRCDEYDDFLGVTRIGDGEEESSFPMESCNIPDDLSARSARDCYRLML